MKHFKLHVSKASGFPQSVKMFLVQIRYQATMLLACIDRQLIWDGILFLGNFDGSNKRDVHHNSIATREESIS